MTTYYVGPGGSDVAAGTAWGTRFLTISKAALVVAAGDTVYIGPGTYRETVTCTVSGTVGNVISWIGDYAGTNTDGVGGVVRITGSNDDISGVRTNGITATSVNYNNFTGFAIDICTNGVLLTSCQNWILNKLHIQSCITSGVQLAGASQLNITVRNCVLDLCSAGAGTPSGCFVITHSATVSNAGHLIESCVMNTVYAGQAGNFNALIEITRVGGFTIKNVTGRGAYVGIRIATALAVGQVVTLLNSIIIGGSAGLIATTLGEIVEDYCCLAYIITARTNVAVGANSVAYPPLFDTRWFFEAVK